MRADAARRRERIVREARHMFAAHGSGIALEAIADASGVGIATLYRNFDSRIALAEEVALAILSDIRDASTTALDRMPRAAADAWRDYLEQLIDLDLGALTAGLGELVAEGLPPRVLDAQTQTLACVDDVLTAARHHTQVEAELSAIDLIVLLGMITRPQPDVIRQATPRLVEHVLDILIGGMRKPARTEKSSPSHG